MKYECCAVLTPDGGSLIFRNIETKAPVVEVSVTSPREAEQIDMMINRLQEHIEWLAAEKVKECHE